jgi:hypothetical protein
MGGKMLPVEGPETTRSARVVARKVGSQRDWLGVDEAVQSFYTKRFTLRAVSKRAEVWVASDRDGTSSRLAFPAGDCRNDERVKITDRRVHYLIHQFDRNIYPTESRVFSVAPPRDGTQALLPSFLTDNNGDPVYPQNYWKGAPRKTVILVDNIRDSNFYDPDNSTNDTYIAGLFSSAINELLDRNVMTIDGFDWLHRTGAHPPNQPAPDPCTNKVAKPFLYEQVFAHEYQHLLEYYKDPNEALWVNEGLSDWAMHLTGYAHPKRPVTKLGFDNHIWSFLGETGTVTPANPVPRVGGPENSLTWWGDQGGRILDDYGAAWTMMEVLASRYGNTFMGRLHRARASGLPGLQKILTQAGVASSPREVIHEWNAAMALDGVLDDGAVLTGGDPRDYRVESLDATVNWDTPAAYATAGAPPNGGDYVRLRDGNGNYLNAGAIDSITFDGGETLPPRPVEWAVDSNPPGRTNPALYSGGDLNLDRTMIQQVSVPPTGADAKLTFDTRYDIEEGWDFGFVQVSTDGGHTWSSLSNADTRSDAQPNALGTVRNNVPGFTGSSGCPHGSQADASCTPSWVPETFDLSDYAGQDVLLGFRYVSDREVAFDGWWVDDIAVGTQTISDGSTLQGWQSPTQVNPESVEGFTVQLIAYDDAHDAAWIATLPLGPGFSGELTGDALRSAIGDTAESVAAIVSYDDSTAKSEGYAPYVLEVNGITQPGGS